METNLFSPPKTILSIFLLLAISCVSSASSFTASTSGNWSSAATWGGNGPGLNITDGSSILIPSGITVTLDSDVIVNNGSSSVSLNGAIVGSKKITITAGTLSGTGSVFIEEIVIGSAGLMSFSGIVNVNRFTNNQAALMLGGILFVNNSLVLMQGVVEIRSGGELDLANNVSVDMAGGSFVVKEGVLVIENKFNLIYSGSASAIGGEANLTGLQNISVNLPSASDVLGLTGGLSVPGMLYLQRGVLNIKDQSLTINGGINTTALGSVSGNEGSGIIINGSGDVGTLAFDANSQLINNLTLNFAAAGQISLTSDVIIGGALVLNQGNLNLNGYNLTLNGSIQSLGTGCLLANNKSGLTIGGAGTADTLTLSASANTIGRLTINTDWNGSVYLASDLKVSELVALKGGSLNLNGQTLTVHGGVMSTGSGSMTGNATSSLIFDGYGGAGTVMFTPGSQIIQNLTINIGSSGGVYLASPLTVTGTLSLLNGTLGILNTDLTIADSATIRGGSAAAYVITNGTGHLVMPVSGAGASAIFPVGTQANYAPLAVTNNAVSIANFGVAAHAGILANGTSGVDISPFQSVVNTSWDVSSSATDGANADLKMFWNSDMQVNGFDNTEAYISRYVNGTWSKGQPAAAAREIDGYLSLVMTGATSFSQYAVFDKNTTTAMKEISAATPFTIYPNPAVENINILVADFDKRPQLEIFDAFGSRIFAQKAETRLTSININYLPAGVYFISLDSKVTQRFIKE